MNNTNASQSAKILRHLKRRPLTPLDALKKFNCLRLGARVFELRSRGHNIKSKLVHRDGKHFAQYSLQ